MDTRRGFSAKTWLLRAATGCMLIPPVVLVAQAGSGGEFSDTGRGGQAGIVRHDPQTTLDSAVQRQLDALYAQKGLSVPDVTSQQSAAQHLATASATPAGRQPAHAAGSDGMLGKLKTAFSVREVEVRPAHQPAHRPAAHAVVAVHNAEDSFAVRQVSHEAGEQLAQAQPSGAKSEVQKQLELLYARDGRQAPPMNLSQMPNTSPPVQGPVVNPASEAAQVSGTPSLWQRVFPSRNSAAERQPAAATPQNADNDERRPGLLPEFLRIGRGSSAGSPAPAPIPAPNAQNESLAGLPPLPPPPVPAPEADLNDLDDSDELDMPPAQSPEIAMPLPATPAEEQAPADEAAPADPLVADAFEDPFTEVSEAEADNKKSPYTGRALDLPEPEMPALPEPELPGLPPLPGEDGFEPPALAGESRQKESLPKVAPEAAREKDALPRIAANPPRNEHQEKMQRIAERIGLTGLKGFCPVALRDSRDLVDSDPSISSMWDSRTWFFSSHEARETFEKNPEKYVPVQGGMDVVALARTGDEIEGQLDYASWFRDRLYLFSSRENMETFTLMPLQFVTE